MNKRFLHEERILQLYTGHVTFGHCPYKEVKDGIEGWDLKACKDFCGPLAYAFRHHHLDVSKGIDPSCIDKMDIVCIYLKRFSSNFNFRLQKSYLQNLVLKKIIF